MIPFDEFQNTITIFILSTLVYLLDVYEVGLIACLILESSSVFNMKVARRLDKNLRNILFYVHVQLYNYLV